MSDNKIVQRSEAITEKWSRQAEEAVAAADLSALRELVREAGGINKKYAQAFDGIVSVFTPNREIRSPESESAIAAMRDVAIAAIELAKIFTSIKETK